MQEAAPPAGPGEIQAWLGLGAAPLFESLLIVETYPETIEAAVRRDGAEIRLSEAAVHERTGLPLTLKVLPGEDLEHGIGPGGLRVLALETGGATSALLLWDANGFAPGMNATLRDGLADRVDTLLLATTDNHYVNIRPGGHNPLSGADFILPAAQTALAEALVDLVPAESAMGRVTIDGVEILGQGMQDRISAAANAVVQVARFSWLPLYGSAAMFCMLLSPYL